MVYVIQEVEGKNVTSARRFGDLKFLLPIGKQVEDTDATVDMMKDKLALFNDKDYLLLIGDPVAIGIATSIAATVNCGAYKILKWDKQEHRYYSFSVEL